MHFGKSEVSETSVSPNVKATQNSTSTTDKTVGYLDRSQWVGRWLVRERKEEDKASPLFSFSQILALLLVINNSILNIQPITSKSLWLGICTWFTVSAFYLLSYYR